MTVSVDLDTAALDRLDAQMVTRLSAVVRAAAFRVEAGAKVAILTGAKSGRVYLRPGGRRHQASAPGQAPANDTGVLANSIRASGETRLTWRVAASARYGAALELGTARMAPRPFLAPALAAVKDWFVAEVRKVFA